MQGNDKENFMGTEEQQPQQQPQKTSLGEKIKQLPKIGRASCRERV